MEFDKNITMEELATIHDEIMVKFTQSDEPVENAARLTEAALKTTEESISELLAFISILNKESQNKVATILQKIVAATYLSAVAEVVKNKQEFNDGEVALRKNSNYPDEPHEWIEFTFNNSYIELANEFPEDYKKINQPIN